MSCRSIIHSFFCRYSYLYGQSLWHWDHVPEIFNLKHEAIFIYISLQTIWVFKSIARQILIILIFNKLSLLWYRATVVDNTRSNSLHWWQICKIALLTIGLYYNILGLSIIPKKYIINNDLGINLTNDNTFTKCHLLKMLYFLNLCEFVNSL